MGPGKPIILTDSSYSVEKEKQAQQQDHISNQRAKNALPVYGFRTKSHPVDYACT